MTSRPAVPSGDTDTASRSSFPWLLATRGAEGFADSLSRALLPIVAVSVLGMGSAYVGVLNSLSLAGFLLLGIPVGTLIDRLVSKTAAMALSTLARVLALTTVAIFLVTGTLNGAVLLLAAMAIGVADVVFTTAETTVIPALVPQSRLKRAYSQLAVTSQSTSTIAALMGSIALGLAGAIGMLIGATSSYLLSLVVQRGVKTRREPARPVSRAAYRLEGFQILMASPALTALTVSAALTNAGVMLGNTMLPVFVLSDLGISPAVFAAMGILSAAGAIAGSAAAPALTRRFGLRRLRVAAALLAGPAVLLAVLCRELPGHDIVWLTAQACLWNLLVSLSSVAGADVLPRVAPRESLASVSAAQRMVTLGIMPISAILGGIIASYTGTSFMMVVWAVLASLAALPLLKARVLDNC